MFIKFADRIFVREATKLRYTVAEPGDFVDIDFPNSKTRRGRVNKYSQTLLKSCSAAIVTDDLELRKITPKEAWRLQGFPDEAFESAQQVCSKEKLYNQAGNAVTVDVIRTIAGKLV
nr:DNA cytosine methyltransferase [Bacillus mycoides]